MEKKQQRRRNLMRGVLWFCSVLFLLGCTDVGKAPGATGEEAAKIEAYAAQAESLDPSRRHLLAAWEKLAEAPTYEGFNSVLRSRLLPAVEAYLTALEGCSVEHPELRKVHSSLVESYGRFVRGLRTLSSKAANRTPAEVEEELRKLLVAARQAQAVYQQDISTLYARSGYRLVTEEEPAQEPAHQNN